MRGQVQKVFDWDGVLQPSQPIGSYRAGVLWVNLLCKTRLKDDADIYPLAKKQLFALNV